VKDRAAMGIVGALHTPAQASARAARRRTSAEGRANREHDFGCRQRIRRPKTERKWS